MKENDFKELNLARVGRVAYVAPLMEIFAVESSEKMLGTSFYGGNGTGTDENGDNDHHGGSDGGIEYGAKSIDILGQEFRFVDSWDR